MQTIMHLVLHLKVCTNKYTMKRDETYQFHTDLTPAEFFSSGLAKALSLNSFRSEERRVGKEC